jgi:benzodiazapine receptor
LKATDQIRNILTLLEKEDARNNLTRRADSIAAGSDPGMAAQSQLGLWPERRIGAGRRDPACVVTDGTFSVLMNDTAKSATIDRRQGLALVGWCALCLATAGTGFFVSVDGWYAGLNKPVWNPPSWLFGPVWTVLYLMMGTAAWLVWRQGGWKFRRWSLGLFLVQLFLNAIWTPVFFAMHQIGLALLDITLLWLVLIATLIAFSRVSRLAWLLLVPYLVWVSFAAFLNFTLWQMN